MCRGFQQNERDRLKIKAFYIQLSALCAATKSSLPEFLTLHYLPRINDSRLEINGSLVRPDSPAFVTLHRVVSGESKKGVVYGSKEKIVVCEGLRFEIYVGDVKVVKGIFRKEEMGESWKMECKCDDVVEGVKTAEVCAVADGPDGVMTERVEMVAPARRKRGLGCQLEEIPEERGEGEVGSDVCGCCECRGEPGEMHGGDCEMEVEVEMEGVRWALDVGIWAVCIGVGTVGYLVSRASSSSKRSRRRRSFI